jgi:simple sugar transport system substrate-binding protein
MAKEDIIHEAVERLEWVERKEEDTPFKKLNQVTRRTALTGGAAGLAALALQACGGSSSSSSASSTASAATSASGSSAASIFGVTQTYKFTFVNHVTTNPFFTPTQNGAADACKLLGCSYQWTGSSTSNVSEMVNAMNSAISAKVNGIAVALISNTSFNGPTNAALAAGIPVVAYNADVAGNNRLAYIGQDLLVSGQKMGEHIASLVPSGNVVLFIATPGAANVQPRIDGAQQTLKSHPSIKTSVVATGAATSAELSAINAYAVGHPSVNGMFAVDGGSTAAVAQTIQKLGLNKKGVKGGGYDLNVPTAQLVAQGFMDFTIDQQPYLQGFFPILELYLYNASQGLTGPADVNTGLKFLDKTTAVPYSNTKSRYEGTSTAPGVQKA